MLLPALWAPGTLLLKNALTSIWLILESRPVRSALCEGPGHPTKRIRNKKFHDAKVSNSPDVEVWGSGTPKREFLHVDDMADASVFLMSNYDDAEFVNVGVGEDVSIKELAEAVKGVTGYEGNLRFDTSKPDGTPRKLLDVSKLNALNWSSKITLVQGLKDTYKWYLEHINEFRQ